MTELFLFREEVTGIYIENVSRMLLIIKFIILYL